MSVCSRIKELCELNQITINKLERGAGITRGSIARWGTNLPSIDKIMKVADYFGVSTDFLLYGQKEKPTTQTDGELSEKDIRLVKWFRSLPEEKQKAILTAQDGPVDAV